MNEQIRENIPKKYLEIDQATKESGFTMSSHILTCGLLRTLAGSKPNGKLLELGTGTGLSTSWILDGMNNGSTLVSIDNDDRLLKIAKRYLGDDDRLSLILSDGGEWIEKNKQLKFDYIFADTWHGKYLLLEEILAMLNPGGLYIIDDMLPQSNWPEGHHDKATNLVNKLEEIDDIILTKQNWATGIIIGVKK